jgi:hypothetical protein
MPDAPDPRDVASLRGAEAQRIGGRFWFVVIVLASIVIAVFIAVSFVAAVNSNSRLERLKTGGIPVVVTVTNCTGNIGGSGSNAAGYTCYGKYRARGVRHHEIIGAKTTFSAAGTAVRAVADPKSPTSIELSSAVAASSPSDSAYLIPSILAVLFLCLALVIVRTRHARGHRGDSHFDSKRTQHD